MSVALSPAPISRSADHYYTYQGKVYPGVTGILKVLDKSDALMNWAARQTAEAALGLMKKDGEFSVYGPLFDIIRETGPEGAIKALTARSSWKRDEAAQLGSDVHGYADDHVNGRQLPPNLDKSIVDRVQAYAAWWAASKWSLRASEAMVVHTAFGYGGTIDLLARDGDGRTVLADIKTGKGVYREAVLQLTAYGMAEVIQIDARVFAMPAVDRYVVLHVTTDGVREIEINVGALEKVAWAACLDLHQWAESMKGKKL